MMLKQLLFLLLLLVFGAVESLAIEVRDAAITTAIVEREPVDSVDVFPRQNGKLYCFTRVSGAEEPTVVYHLWYREDELMSRVELAVNSSSWRTWSAKRLLADWPGQWRVDIQDSSGKLIHQLRFELL